MSTEAHKAVPASGGARPGWMPLRHGLSRTLLIWFLLVSVMSLVGAGLIITALAVRNAHQAAVERLSAIATLKESEINAWIASQQAELDLILNTPYIRSKLLDVLNTKTHDRLAAPTRDELQEYASLITSKGSAFEELFLMDASGRVVLSSNPGQVGGFHTRQAYFVKGQAGPYVQPAYYSLFTAAPSMLVAQPVQDDGGQVCGVLAARLNLDQIAQVMKEDAGLGQTGDTYLVNAAGLLLTPPRLGQELAPGQQLRSEGVERGLALGNSTSRMQAGWSMYTNYRGRLVLGVYRWLPELQMVLLAEQEVSETLALTRDILVVGLAALLIITGVAVGVASWLSQRITRPLAGLTATANLIADGDLSQPVPYMERQDEIGLLAWAFDRMSQQLRELIAGLENQVAARTRQWQEANYKLQRRAIQLEASTLVGRAATSILNLDDLLLEVVNLIRSRFDFYHAGIFLLDESGEWAVLRQATGEAGQRMLARKHQLAVGGQSMVGWVTANRQPRIALDVGVDAVHFKNPDLPHTRSELVLPLVVGDRLLGALDVQSLEEAAFDQEDVAVLSLMADQVAVAINNALKFLEEAAILEATSPLFHASRQIIMATSLDDVLKSMLNHAAGTHVDRCSLHLYRAGTGSQEAGWIEVAALWDRAREAPHPPGTRYPVPPSSLMEHLRQGGAEPLVIDDLAVSQVDPRLDRQTRHTLTEVLQLRAVLLLPLAIAGRTIGLLMVASRQPHVWTPTELRTFRSLCDLAAAVVENMRLLEETQARAAWEQLIRHISEPMWRAADVESILQTTVTRLGQALGARRVYARLIPPAEPQQGNGNGSIQDSSLY